MTWIQTRHRSEPTYPLALTPDQVDVRDIAHALALKCRWTGHTRTFYSVAEHSVRVARLLPPEMQIHGLLHDAAEAYLPDIASPIKGEFRCYSEPAGYGDFALTEKCVLLAIYGAFGVPMPERMPWALKHADLVLLSTEARDLMHGTEGWTWEPTEPLHDMIEPWSWQGARVEWLDMWERLKP